VNRIERAYYWFLHHFDFSYTKRILLESVDLLAMLWPYLVGGIILSTLIYLYLSKQYIASLFSRRGKHLSIFMAAFIGILSPVGSYVLIPLSAALVAIGVPLPVLMALMVSSPLINPNLFLLTAGSMGMEMALMRVLSAFFLGLSAGYLTQLTIKTGWIKAETIINSGSSYSMKSFPIDRPKKNLKLFLTELWKMTRWIGRYFFWAILLAAAIKILINPVYFGRLFGSNPFLSVLATTAAGVPFYVCGGAAIPVVEQLAELGLSKGAALAFFISGPITKISNLIILGAVFNRKVLWVYLFLGLMGAVLMGILYDCISMI